MIGLGKWKADIDTMVFTGTAVLVIGEKDGKYTMELELPGSDGFVPHLTVINAEEDDDILTADVEADILKGKTIEISLTFNKTEANGYIKIPLVGKIKLRHAEKIG